MIITLTSLLRQTVYHSFIGFIPGFYFVLCLEHISLSSHFA